VFRYGLGRPFSDRINRMDRIKKYESKINADNPVNPGWLRNLMTPAVLPG
jgi:hypothetical protein